MRLICPNCDAQYEVPDDVIPVSGRDVQCSNCGTTWFFTPGDPQGGTVDAAQVDAAQGDAQADEMRPSETIAEAEEPAEPQTDTTAEPPVDEATTQQTEPVRDDAPEISQSASLTEEAVSTSDESPPETAPPTTDAPLSDAPSDGPADASAEAPKDAPVRKRRKLDPEIESLLREEAAFEARARAAERNTLETQPDLGLPAGDARDIGAGRKAADARTRMERFTGDSMPGPDGAPVRSTPPEPTSASSEANSASNMRPKRQRPDASSAATANEGSRRDLLPDIEQINSTLSAEIAPPRADQGHAQDEEGRKASRAGRKGLLLTVALSSLATAVYVFAPEISQSVPELAEPLTGYVTAIDQGRAWLDGQILKGLAWLDEVVSEANSNGGDPT